MLRVFFPKVDHTDVVQILMQNEEENEIFASQKRLLDFYYVTEELQIYGITRADARNIFDGISDKYGRLHNSMCPRRQYLKIRRLSQIL